MLQFACIFNEQEVANSAWPAVRLRYKVSRATFTSFYCRTSARAFPTNIVHLLAIPDGQNLRQKLRALVYQIFIYTPKESSHWAQSSADHRWTVGCCMRTLLMRKLLALLATIQISIERKLLARPNYNSWTTQESDTTFEKNSHAIGHCLMCVGRL